MSTSDILSAATAAAAGASVAILVLHMCKRPVHTYTREGFAEDTRLIMTTEPGTGTMDTLLLSDVYNGLFENVMNAVNNLNTILNINALSTASHVSTPNLQSPSGTLTFHSTTDLNGNLFTNATINMHGVSPSEPVRELLVESQTRNTSSMLSLPFMHGMVLAGDHPTATAKYVSVSMVGDPGTLNNELINFRDVANAALFQPVVLNASLLVSLATPVKLSYMARGEALSDDILEVLHLSLCHMNSLHVTSQRSRLSFIYTGSYHVRIWQGTNFSGALIGQYPPHTAFDISGHFSGSQGSIQLRLTGQHF